MNPDTLARCIPGCKHVIPDGTNRYRITGSVGIAFLRKHYQATFAFTETDPPCSCRITITNDDGQAGQAVTAQVTLEPAPS